MRSGSWSITRVRTRRRCRYPVLVAYRERDLTGLSPSTWALTASDGAVWTIYGLSTGDVHVVNNLFQFTTSMAILLRRLAWGRRRLAAAESPTR